MRSTFLGFNSARSGLFAAQRSLDITGHNIANVNTRGYTRQRLEQGASMPLHIPQGQGMLGTGVDTLGVNQVRNEFLDFKYRQEATDLGYWQTRQEGLHMLEVIFNEPSDSGITTNIDDFFYSVDALSKNPEDLTTRAQLREETVAVTSNINHLYTQMERQVMDLNTEVYNTTRDINALTKGIAQLNEQIDKAEVDGSRANDLRDERNVLLDDLSRLADVRVTEYVDEGSSLGGNVNKKLMIELNGRPLVDHHRHYEIGVKESKTNIYEGEADELEIPIYTLTWNNREDLDMTTVGGELQGFLDLRDGETEGTKGYPYYMKKLNEFARTFASEVNELHAKGYGLNSDELKDTDGNSIHPDGGGYLLFTADGKSSDSMYDSDGKIMHGNINAKNIRISSDIDKDLNKIAAASSKEDLPGDGSIANQIGQLRGDRTMFSEGKPEDYLKSLIGNLGVDAKEAIRNTNNQALITDLLDNQRQSVSGVSLDEEMSNMVKFQHAYNASARMITTMDEMLDVIINRLGTVGR